MRKHVTPFNIIAGIILGVAAVITVMRFGIGLSATTNLDDTTPWGLWIGFDVMAGVALAAGGFTISTAVYLFGMKEYKPIVRAALLTGFLGYFLVVVGLLFDLGRPWRLPYPFTISPGTSSPLFEVALCVALYLNVLFIESTPAAFEWLGWKRMRRIVGGLTIGLTIFGLLLSTLHQSTLGAMFMVVPSKLHPLWYSSHIPVHFFISSVAAGISMVTIEGMISHRVYHDEVEITSEQFDRITIGLGKAGAVTLAIYLAVRAVGLGLEGEWALLGTPYGAWWLVEIIGFAALPCFLFTMGYRERRATMIRVAAGITVVGIVLNRLNVAVFAFNWQLPWDQRYWPGWMEIWITISLVTAGVVMFRWIANRMPIMHEHPEWKGSH
ncbi:MAG: polysulfide reductase NrfD [Deltaproteobacteria bacterium]|nr:polysulfide reductase NrfD [Deltaproteobacteria bacterium]